MKKIISFVLCILIIFSSIIINDSTAFASEEKVVVVKKMSSSSEYKKSDKFSVSFRKHPKDLLQNDVSILKLKNVNKKMSVSFKSSNSSILSVKKISNSSCKVIGKSYGKANVIATVKTNSGFFIFSNNNTIKTTYKVSPRAASIKFNKKTKKISVGSSAKVPIIIRPSISKEKPRYYLDNPKFATVNPNGRITALKPGTTYLYGVISNGRTCRCKIVIKK